MPTFTEDLRLILSSLEEEISNGRFGDAAELSGANDRTRNRLRFLAGLSADWRKRAAESAAMGSIAYDGKYIQSTLEAEKNGLADGKAIALKACAATLEELGASEKWTETA